MAKTSGGTRNYSSSPSTFEKRKAEFESLMNDGKHDRSQSYFDKSGGFVAVADGRTPISEAKKNEDKADFAAMALAKKGYKVYLDKDSSTIDGMRMADGKVYSVKMDIKTINTAGNYTIKKSLESAAGQNARVVILMQNTKDMTRTYVESQLELFSDKSPRKCRAQIEMVIVVGANGHVHRHRLPKPK